MARDVEHREVDPLAPHRESPVAPPWTGPIAGLVSGACAVFAGVLLAAIAGWTSPVDAVGSEFIDRTPSWLREWAIETFGTNDKAALRLGIWVTLAVAAVIVGTIARRHIRIGLVGVASFGLIGVSAGLHRPGASSTAALPPLVGAIVGGALLCWLISMVGASDGIREHPRRSRAPLGWDRRRFLVASGTAAAGVAIATRTAEVLNGRRLDRLRASGPDALPPLRAASSGAVPPGAEVSPITPFVTPNEDFYRVDTVLSLPVVDISRWTFDVRGLVSRPLQLTYDELLSRPMIERMITLTCVSIDIGGTLIGNAVWQGVPLADLLNEAGVDPTAEQVFLRSVDGYTSGFPVSLALDGRDALVAIGMNGDPLPVEHGFPARLIVPGLYGYVSATKWLRTVEVNRWDDEVGYWVRRGWGRAGSVETQSRIDVPRARTPIAAGRTVIAGIAWAQHTGVEAVEVRIDGGDWLAADLGSEVGDDVWRQWRLEWNATPGEHVLQVRATDKSGYTQTEEVRAPEPEGATGWHTRRVKVEQPQ